MGHSIHAIHTDDADFLLTWASKQITPITSTKVAEECSRSQIWQHSFVQIDHEIFSAVILSILLIQEGQLSVSCKRMCTSTGYLLRVLSLLRNKCD